MARDNDIQDPFSWAYNRIFSLLEAHEPFCSQFKKGNLIRFDSGENNPQKDGVTTSDFPYVTLRESTFNGRQETSSTHVWHQRYDLMITTNNWHVRRINRLKYHAWVALMYWKHRVHLEPYTAEGYRRTDLITNVAVDDGQQGQAQNLSTSEKISIPEGFSSLFTVNVRLHFETSDILPPITN